MGVKGAILAAGYGTRFLPVTRSIPKEMLPLIDRPALDFIVQEFIDAGIEEILLISSHRKAAMESWFSPDADLDRVLLRDGKTEAYAKARPPNVRVQIVHQQRMRGTGDALMLVREFAGEDPVVVAFPDDLFGEPNCSKQLIETWKATGQSVLSVGDFSGRDVSRYGVVDGVMQEDFIQVREVVEKPAIGTEPSHWVSLGRYLYTSDFWPNLAVLHAKHVGEGEFYPMGAMNQLAFDGKMAARIVDAPRFDTGEPLGYLKTVVTFALARNDIGPAFLQWLKETVQE